jgi:hypothetical protein
MIISANDMAGLSSNRTFQHSIIRGIPTDDGESLFGVNHMSDNGQQS